MFIVYIMEDHTTEPVNTLIMVDERATISSGSREVSPSLECSALKNIKYKIMQMAPGNSPGGESVVGVDHRTVNSYDTIQRFLDDERTHTIGYTWNKLTKSLKHKKIQEYVFKYTKDNSLSEPETVLLGSYLSGKINTGHLSTSKAVTYNKTTGMIDDIPGMVFNRSNRHITIKNVEPKHMTTLKKLKPILKNTIEV
jgi:hypothetical protein